MAYNSWVIEKLNKLASMQPEKEAIKYYRTRGRTEVYTFAQLLDVVLLYANRNKQIGITAGDRVVMLIPLSMSAYINMLSLAYIGATIVPLSEKLDESELQNLIETVEPSCIIADQELYQSRIRNVSCAAYKDGETVEAYNNYEFQKTGDPNPQAMFLLFSSGTTAKSKGVMIGYQEELNAFKNFDKVIPHTMERYLAMYPIYHVGGVTSFFVSLLWLEMTVAIMEETSAVQLSHVFSLYRPNLFIMVPALITAMKEQIENRMGKLSKLVGPLSWIRKNLGINLGKYMFRSVNEQAFGGCLELITSGGGVIDPSVLHFYYGLGVDVCDLYASTEGNAPIILNRGGEYYQGAKVSDFSPEISYRIDNPDASGVGEILLKSNSMMLGYFRDDALTKDSFKDGYFKTGDLGRIQNGYLTVTGRKKDSVFLQNGEKISIVQAEDAIREKLNLDVPFALVSLKDKKEQYDIIHLCIEGKAGQYDSLLAEVCSHINEDYQFKRVHYVDEIPVTPLGKVKRHVLADYVKCKMDVKRKEETENESNTVLEFTINDASQSSSEKSAKKRSLYAIIADYTEQKNLEKTHRFREDLGMDSLSMFQLFVALEEELGLEIPKSLEQIRRVGDLENYILGSMKLKQTHKDFNRYPYRRTRRLQAFLEQTISDIQKKNNIGVVGIENIPKDSNMIICSNHLHFMDPYYIFAAFGNEYVRNQKFSVLAYSFWKYSKRFRAIGAIPVRPLGDRTGAIMRALRCLEEGYDLLIFPEAHLNRNLNNLRNGAAMLAIESQKPILPVYIEEVHGAMTIFIGQLIWVKESDHQEVVTDKVYTAILEARKQGE